MTKLPPAQHVEDRNAAFTHAFYNTCQSFQSLQSAIHFHNQQQQQQQQFDSVPPLFSITATIDELKFVALNGNENDAARFYH